MAKCIRVPKKEGEPVRRALAEEGLLDLHFRIGGDGDCILIPVTCDSYQGYDAMEAELRPQEHGNTDYRDHVDIPEELKALLPMSHDVVGDIAITKLEDELLPYRHGIGEALMKVSPNIRAVFLDDGVKGEYRVRDLERIAGTGTSEVIHKEFGTRLMTDPSKVYFNPRLSNERARVAKMVKPGEVIIDMFAGVAPFGSVICKNASPGMVYSIDLNPECEKYMRENVRLNHIKNMECMIGDSTQLVKGLPKADRVIMNLPQMADQFLDSALGIVKPTGIIHMHKIMERADMEHYPDDLKKAMAEKGFGMRIAEVSELKTYSPTMSVYVFDIVPEF
ncbi:MAG: class I SAM-dependent methyltransferase family protein [archaeon]|nr:class I SAM-dependent methyltransferase family protein [archaeon]